MIAQKKSKKEEEDVVIQKAELKTKRKTIKFQQNSGVGCSRGKKMVQKKKPTGFSDESIYDELWR